MQRYFLLEHICEDGYAPSWGWWWYFYIPKSWN